MKTISDPHPIRTLQPELGYNKSISTDDSRFRTILFLTPHIPDVSDVISKRDTKKSFLKTSRRYGVNPQPRLHFGSTKVTKDIHSWASNSICSIRYDFLYTYIYVRPAPKEPGRAESKRRRAAGILMEISKGNRSFYVKVKTPNYYKGPGAGKKRPLNDFIYRKHVSNRS